MFDWLKKVSTQKQEGIKANCPYCSVELEKFPTRKQKCKSCGKDFVVRTHYITKSKIVFTENDAAKYDVEKEKYYLDKSLIDGLKLDIRVNKDEVDRLVEKTKVDLAKKFGQAASLGDVAWSVANKMSMDAMKKGDLGLLQSFQFQMALYLHYCGKDGNSLRESYFDIQLKNFKKSDVVNKVTVLATTDSCEQCKLLNGKVFNIDEAIKQKILPCKSCTYKLDSKAKFGWCRCCYSPEVEM